MKRLKQPENVNGIVFRNARRRITTEGLFDKIADHLIKQGRRSTFASGEPVGCAYRGPDGMSCAVGCVIKDSVYAQFNVPGDRNKLENKTTHDNNVMTAIEQSIQRGITYYEHLMLATLQSLHDSSDPEKWAERLKEQRGYLAADVQRAAETQQRAA